MGGIPTVEEVRDLFHIIMIHHKDMEFSKKIIATIGKEAGNDMYWTLRSLVDEKYSLTNIEYQELLDAVKRDTTDENLVKTRDELQKMIDAIPPHVGYSGPHANQFGKGGRRKTRRSNSYHKRKTRSRRHPRRH